MKQKNKSNNPTEQVNIEPAFQFLEHIARKRNGGAVNLRGINFQILYSCLTILNHLNDGPDTKSIRLEGIEDLDLKIPHLRVDQYEYIQLKSSQNTLNAGVFWDLGVLQNFLEVYLQEPNSKFRLVYNMKVADGHLSVLISDDLNDKSLEYWQEKFDSLNVTSKTFDFRHFLNQITYEYITVDQLSVQIVKILFQTWKINKGTELQFLKSLFYHVFVWSKERKEICYPDIRNLFQEITDAFSKSVINEAITHDWISTVSYPTKGDKDLSEYFEGKAAKPIHISCGIPARRKKWEKAIEDSLAIADVTIIRSSSGQGKSTLAWQVGFNQLSKYTPYQLNFCADWNNVNAISDFLVSRIYIGQLPLVIIDGLNTSVKSWALLAEKTADIPVKYLITSRQEEWYRYGADVSKLRLQTVEILLTQPEAKDIYEQLKGKGKIHAGVRTWEPVWEQIQQQGLLIEYTYLLTRGQMIHDRLKDQLKTLNLGKSAAAKLEILRLISLADCLNLKVETAKLIKHINDTVRFEQDRGEVFKELEHEYFLNFDSRNVVGLHPVRSRHLMELLHESIPIEESLLALYDTINPDFRYDFYVHAPALVTNEGKPLFYNELSSKLVNQQFSEMVYALDGTLHGEPQRYYLDNIKIFDDAFERGGIEVFISDTIPFTKLNTLQSLAESLSADIAENFLYLANKSKELPRYTFTDTDVARFALSLKNALKTRTAPIISYEGLEFLKKWFDRLEIDLDLKIPFDKGKLITDLPSLDLQEAKEIFMYYQLNDIDGYRDFISVNKKEIISYLKLKTNSLTIEEIGNEIHINYLLSDKDVENANGLSVYRIQTIQSFLPAYDQYCTEAIMLPFPSEELIAVVKSNSTKRMTAESIGDLSKVHLNQIWVSTILSNYSAQSAYDWQQALIKIRLEGLELVKCVTRILDAKFEGNQKKLQSNINITLIQRTLLSELLTRIKTYPTYGQKYFDVKKFKEQEQVINSWFGSLRNYNMQFPYIFSLDPDSQRHLVMINYKSAYFSIDKMQLAFAHVEANTFVYFDTKTLLSEEGIWYSRLYQSMLYYLAHEPLKNPVAVGRKAVSEWWEKNHDKSLKKLDHILSVVENSSDYKFYRPNKLVQTDTLTFATFALEGMDLSIEENLWNLSAALSPLAEFEADFFTLLNIQDNTCTGGLRFKKEYFEMFASLKNGIIPQLEGMTPVPVVPDQEVISLFPGMKLPVANGDPIKEAQVLIIFDLWKLCEHRARLDTTSALEKNWLEKEENRYVGTINENLVIVKGANHVTSKFELYVLSILNGNEDYNMDDIVYELFQVLKAD